MSEFKFCEEPGCHKPFYRQGTRACNWNRQRYCSPACAKRHYLATHRRAVEVESLVKKCACGCGQYFKKPDHIIGKNWDHIKYMNLDHQREALGRTRRTVTLVHYDSLHTKHIQHYLCPSDKWQAITECVAQGGDR